MKNKIFDVIILISGIISLITLSTVLKNLGIFIDEHNLSLNNVLGSNTLVYMYWITLFLLLIICCTSIIKLIKK